MNFEITQERVLQWSKDCQIIPNSTAKAQATKTLEEAGEVLEAASALYVLDSIGIDPSNPTYQAWVAKLKDGIGDVMVTLVNVSALANVNILECFNGSYQEIKDRKGTMNVNGVFVKDK